MYFEGRGAPQQAQPVNWVLREKKKEAYLNVEMVEGGPGSPLWEQHHSGGVMVCNQTREGKRVGEEHHQWGAELSPP